MKISGELAKVRDAHKEMQNALAHRQSENKCGHVFSSSLGKNMTLTQSIKGMIMKRAILTMAACLAFTPTAWSQMGPGMMGAQGHGMMGGYGMGMGPGMMEGYGMGPGMMGGWGPNIPDMTDEQRTKIAAIQKEFRQKQWALMEKMHENSYSNNFYRSGKFDEKAARKAYDESAALHKQMFENFLDMQKRIDNLLTPKQREQLQRSS